MEDAWELGPVGEDGSAPPGGLTWKHLHPEGPTPHARCSHVAGALAGAAPSLLVLGGSYYADGGGLVPLGDAAVLELGGADGTGAAAAGARWVAPVVEGSAPRPRNAATLVPLPPAGAERGRFLYHGGWKAFKETYNDTYIVVVE